MDQVLAGLVLGGCIGFLLAFFITWWLCKPYKDYHDD